MKKIDSYADIIRRCNYLAGRNDVTLVELCRLFNVKRNQAYLNANKLGIPKSLTKNTSKPIVIYHVHDWITSNELRK